ncbi:MAG: hypothetical protein IRZ05_21300 [Micromonosporaceae bacterium]|jgi:hypothetical protein|nr:hypothetical protein [Micromonosporaceae bacterium]
MVHRAVIALLVPVPWHPPGIDPVAWRTALAEDVVDLLATLAEVEPAIAVTAADRALASAVAWPTMPVYEVPAPTPRAAFAAAAADGFDQAAVLAADAPDLPGLLVAKLLRPLTTRPLAVAPATSAGAPAGLLGIAARLPAPDWLPDLDLDQGSPVALRKAAPSPTGVVAAPGWRRIRGPADLDTLDPAVEGWDATRTLLHT